MEMRYLGLLQTYKSYLLQDSEQAVRVAVGKLGGQIDDKA
ncbi:hypothetical protein J2Z66_008428 [Paenibacillus eucommiae]|uniref:Uncharacterized protein n=1 Tax=Paenibacillus eucommiae TaxID=1355755 RepID=A0ABS4JAF4_9BACL|nr:hypothetical protein [Paenibacillus eucommiae]